jgi:RNA polymerase sigma-70 factor (ECF subfamily)
MTEKLTSSKHSIREYIGFSDDILIRLIADNNDGQAYTLLMQRYTQKILRLAFSVLNNKSEAEDVTQDVFMMLMTALKDWDASRNAKFSTWVYRVAFNKAIDMKRKRRHAQAIDDLEIMSQDKSGYEAVLEQQVSSQVQDLLKQLPDTQRDALFMYYYKEMTVEEIAYHMNKTEQSVRSLLKRGKSIMKDNALRTHSLDWDSASKLLS